MTRTGRNLLFLLSLLFSLVASAKVDVSSVAETDEVVLGEAFEFVVRVSTDEDLEVEEPRFDQISGFQIRSQGRSESSVHRLGQTSSGMQFSVQRTTEFRYVLIGLEVGRKTIPSVEVKVGNQVHRTKPLLINVLEQGSNPRRPQRPGGQQRPGGAGPPGMPPGFDDFLGEDDMFEQLLQQRQRLLQNFAQQNPGIGGGFQNAPSEPLFDPEFRSLPKNPNEAFFVQVEVDKLEAYEGEQVTVAWAIYTRGSMESLDRVKFPSLRGFWKEIIEEVPALQFEEEIVNGVPYRRALLAAHALFPIKAGTATIDEFKIKARVRTFNQGWNQKANEYTKSSDSVAIKVKKLPLEGRPSEFTGAVGDFEIRASVDKPNLVSHQPFSLRIRIEGKGNAKTVELPGLELPPELEMYDTKSETRFFKNGTSFKEFEVLVIPRKSGPVKIPSLKLGFFDPKKEAYYVKETEILELQIAEGEPQETPAASGTSLSVNPPAKEAQVEEKAFVPQIETEIQGSTMSSLLLSRWLETGGLLLAIFTLLGQWGAAMWGGQKKVRLKTQIQKRHNHLKDLIKKMEVRKVGAEALNLIFDVVSEASGLESSSLNSAELLQQLPLSFKNKFGEKLTGRIQVFEEMAFAPEALLQNYSNPGKLSTEVEELTQLLYQIVSTYHQDE